MSSDPALKMRADESVRELATILAKGVLRWRQKRRLVENPTCPDSSQPGLEVPSETVLSVVVRVNGSESPQP